MDDFTFSFSILLTVIGIVSSAIIALLFKFVWKPKIEDIYEENLHYSIDRLFEMINRLDEQYDWLTNVIKENEAITTRNEHCYKFGKGILDELEKNVDYFEKYMSSKFLNYTLRYAWKTVDIMYSAKSNKDVQTGFKQRAQYAKLVLRSVKKNRLDKKSIKNLNNFVQRWKDLLE